jgi:hypothetical protein
MPQPWSSHLHSEQLYYNRFICTVHIWALIIKYEFTKCKTIIHKSYYSNYLISTDFCSGRQMATDAVYANFTTRILKKIQTCHFFIFILRYKLYFVSSDSLLASTSHGLQFQSIGFIATAF